MKLIVQAKLLPSDQQALSLLRTLEMVNAAANRLSQLAWDAQQFNRFTLQQLFYPQLRNEFPLSAQVVIRLIAKVADAYKLDRKRQRVFRKHGSIAYDLRILSWKCQAQTLNLWTLDGRQTIPYVANESQLATLANSKRGESDLCYRNGRWLLFVTVEVPEIARIQVSGWLGVDLGLVAIAQTSDGARFAGGQLNGLRARHRRIRRKLQAKGTRSAKRVLRKRRLREARFSRDVNHQISKQIVSVAQRTGRGIALEGLEGYPQPDKGSKEATESSA